MNRAMAGGGPLVSCIMPTRNRRWFVALAVGYFQRQHYAERELIVIDDGEEPIADLLRGDPRIRHIRLAGRHSAGHKRNLGIAASRGAVIALWDDDDGYSADRLGRQLRPILHDGADISGLRGGLVYDISESAFWRCSDELHRRLFFGDVHGRSLMFTRQVWESPLRFDDHSVGEDARFLRRALERRFRLARVDGARDLVYVRHRDNAWRFDCGRFLDPGGWRRCQAPPWLGEAERAAYRRYPRVSCIMPTRDRRRFVPQAIDYFLRQDYPERELLIVDDGDTPVDDLLPDDPRIALLRPTGKATIGAKRNLACEQATGDVIMLWDDDDWYADQRIRYQMQPLLDGQADVTGLRDCLLLHLPTREFWRCGRELQERMFFAGMVGGTLAFRRRLWRQGARFPASSLGEDAQMLKALIRKGARVRKLANRDIFVYIRHHANSWRFATGSFMDRDAWARVARPAFVPPGDLRFYGLAP